MDMCISPPNHGPVNEKRKIVINCIIFVNCIAQKWRHNGDLDMIIAGNLTDMTVKYGKAYHVHVQHNWI